MTTNLNRLVELIQILKDSIDYTNENHCNLMLSIEYKILELNNYIESQLNNPTLIFTPNLNIERKTNKKVDELIKIFGPLIISYLALTSD